MESLSELAGGAGAEPAVVAGVGGALAEEIGDVTAAVPADDETTAPAGDVIGTKKPAEMTDAEIARELESAETGSAHLTRARVVFEKNMEEYRRDREEIKVFEDEAQRDYAAANEFAHKLMKRRVMLEREREMRAKKAS